MIKGAGRQTESLSTSLLKLNLNQLLKLVLKQRIRRQTDASQHAISQRHPAAKGREASVIKRNHRKSDFSSLVFQNCHFHAKKEVAVQKIFFFFFFGKSCHKSSVAPQVDLIDLMDHFGLQISSSDTYEESETIQGKNNSCFGRGFILGCVPLFPIKKIKKKQVWRQLLTLKFTPESSDGRLLQSVQL